tara:strand:+ start:549 stop:764 length:216 start_codon:yes stop_codon:yes gene_type:complete
MGPLKSWQPSTSLGNRCQLPLGESSAEGAADPRQISVILPLDTFPDKRINVAGKVFYAFAGIFQTKTKTLL